MSGEVQRPNGALALRAHLALRRSPGFRLDVSLALPPGVTVLLGPSGAGKSTILDMLAGHLLPDAGHIELGDTVLLRRENGLRPTCNLLAQARRIGYVMQTSALFPHLTVRANLAYGIAGLSARARDARLEEVSAALDLSALLPRWPLSLSGGERQRVALGRALAPRPRALLLDEPLSAVDLLHRDALLERLRNLLSALAIPVLYVTHSLEEQRFFCASQSGLHLRLQPSGAGCIEAVPATL